MIIMDTSYFAVLPNTNGHPVVKPWKTQADSIWLPRSFPVTQNVGLSLSWISVRQGNAVNRVLDHGIIFFLSFFFSSLSIFTNTICEEEKELYIIPTSAAYLEKGNKGTTTNVSASSLKWYINISCVCRQEANVNKHEVHDAILSS